MNAPLVRLSAIIILALFATSYAEPPAKTEDKAKLVTRVYEAAPSFFFKPSSSGRKGTNPNSASKKLPPTTDGEMRYDVWKFFEECGVKKAPGAEAIYLGDAAVVIVTASSEMHGLIERILGGCGGCGYPVKFAEISASLWEYEDDQFAEAAPGRHHFADLRQRAGSSLKLIDSQSIVTKSGQRATAFSKQADTARAPVAASVAKPAGAAPGDNASRTGLNGARGSLLEVEPTIGPDGETVDMAINYEARFKRTGGEQDVEVNVQTNLTLMSNQDTIPYCALAHDDGLPAQQGKLKRRALVVVARVIDADGRTVEEREKQRVQKEEQLIRRARAGLDAPGK